MDKSIYYGIDYGNRPSYTAVIVWCGGRAYGKTFYSMLWMRWLSTELVSQQLIRKLAAEAVINIALNS